MTICIDIAYIREAKAKRTTMDTVGPFDAQILAGACRVMAHTDRGLKGDETGRLPCIAGQSYWMTTGIVRSRAEYDFASSD